MDSKTLHLTEAVAALLLSGSRTFSGDHPITTFAFGVIYQETSSQCPTSEVLLPYRLTVDGPTRTLRMSEDGSRISPDVETIRSVDELERMTITVRRVAYTPPGRCPSLSRDGKACRDEVK